MFLGQPEQHSSESSSEVGRKDGGAAQSRSENGEDWGRDPQHGEDRLADQRAAHGENKVLGAGLLQDRESSSSRARGGERENIA